MYVYVQGIGGLGNTLFQIASALWQAQEHNLELQIQRSDVTLFGTSQRFGRKNTIPYDQTILKQFEFVDTIQDAKSIQTDYSVTRMIPTTHVLIRGYCQHRDFILPILPRMKQLIPIRDTPQNLKDSVVLTIRRGPDFSHMKRITNHSYEKALDYLTEQGVDTKKLFIIADIPNSWKSVKQPGVEIQTNDVTQLYAAANASTLILSESTFHLWIAQLGNASQVIYFKNTDLTTRNLVLDSWIGLEC